ncbi:unnamed protein product [Psylliodes chrysocephalus]|uniref:Uncharacterized protein n=1 Tax=Psylliodes chrysocephalus TaxID=3402493 RepID=A0A9P0CLJ2_9CUCU|nr:unnamed protein product [Psylliodes chrysocephala]
MDFFEKKKYEFPTKCVTKIAGLSIIQAAEAKSDDRFLCEIKDVDFIARKVHHYNNCHKEYTRLPDRRLHAAPESESLAQQKVHRGVERSLLPPCKASLENHISRVNYQCYIWNNAHVAKSMAPSPVRHGWKLENGQVKIDWIKGDPLPPELTDVMESYHPDEFEDGDEPDLVTFTDILHEVDEDEEKSY